MGENEKRPRMGDKLSGIKKRLEPRKERAKGHIRRGISGAMGGRKRRRKR